MGRRYETKAVRQVYGNHLTAALQTRGIHQADWLFPTKSLQAGHVAHPVCLVDGEAHWIELSACRDRIRGRPESGSLGLIAKAEGETRKDRVGKGSSPFHHQPLLKRLRNPDSRKGKAGGTNENLAHFAHRGCLSDGLVRQTGASPGAAWRGLARLGGAWHG